ncbi:MAG TPA: hypothetical protein VF297_02200 [Pyrinomonadaceae bacterium]
MNNGQPPVFKQLDHLIARVEEPARLFETLTGALGLPVAWPLASYPAFQSGGVALGNLYLEIMQCGARRPSRPGRFRAIAYEAPPIAEAVRELSLRGIPHTPAGPYVERGADGKKTLIWSNAVLGRMLGKDFLLDLTVTLSKLPGASRMSDAGSGSALDRFQLDKLFGRNFVFFVEYFYENINDRPFWSEFKDHDEKRAADLARLRDAGGGAVGLEAVEEITAGVRDLDAARELWKRLYTPAAETAPGLFRTGDDPAVRLVHAERDSIQTLVLKVSDLARAESSLRGRGLLGPTVEGQVRLDPAKLEGLDVRLVA